MSDQTWTSAGEPSEEDGLVLLALSDYPIPVVGCCRFTSDSHQWYWYDHRKEEWKECPGDVTHWQYVDDVPGQESEE